MSTFTDNVALFTTRADQRVNELRRDYAGIAVECILLGDTEAAQGVMLDCLSAQAKVAGIRLLEVVA